jgi:hypothetical protein
VGLSGESTKEVKFPFCDSPDKLDFFIKERKLSRAGPEVVALVKSLKPYKGGNTALRAIHDLDIRDKHEALTPLTSGGTSPSAKVRFFRVLALPQSHQFHRASRMVNIC